jgi:hypothetical protein
VNRHQAEVVAYLQEENRVLREQLRGRRLRFTDAQRRRLAANGRAVGRRALEQLAGLVTPDTILRWYRELIAKKYDGTAQRQGDRPGTATSLQIKRILVEHGLDPAPKRGKTMPWKTFLKAHLGVIAATDFFTVEALTLGGLVRPSQHPERPHGRRGLYQPPHVHRVCTPHQVTNRLSCRQRSGLVRSARPRAMLTENAPAGRADRSRARRADRERAADREP